MTDIEKSSLPHSPSLETETEKEKTHPPTDSTAAGAGSYDDRKLLRKIDARLIPWLSFLYLLSFLDRTSIGNAKLYGLEKSLHLTDKQYLLSLTIFFFSYAFFEVPSNVFLKRLRPSVWLSFLMLCWGVIMTVQGLVHNYSGLLAIRFMLGVFEAGLFPGVAFYLSCWYKRSEFGVRTAVFFSAATISGAFGGLLATAINKMDGVGGKPGWAWIFILEGLLTVVAGAVSFWIIQDFPDTAKFLTEEERHRVMQRLQEDNQFSAGGEKLKLNYIISAFQDWKMWLMMMAYVGIDMPLYSISLFTPTIIKELGFKNPNVANLLTVPVYSLACVVTCLVGFFSDRWGQRGYVHMALLSMSAVGYIILICSHNAALSYFAVFLTACGIYPAIPNAVAWVSNNVEGSYKRSVAIAMTVSFGNLNGAVSSNVYRAKDSPRYRLGHGLVLMYIGIGIIASVICRFLLNRENQRRDRGERDEVIKGDAGDGQGNIVNGVFESVEDAKREKGDEWSGYRYTL